jgi:hypothetical protein
MGTEQDTSWVVYKMTLHGRKFGQNAVCSQSDWEAIELDRPGYHTLIRAGITNEQDAERLARADRGGTEVSVRLKAR